MLTAIGNTVFPFYCKVSVEKSSWENSRDQNKQRNFQGGENVTTSG